MKRVIYIFECIMIYTVSAFAVCPLLVIIVIKSVYILLGINGNLLSYIVQSKEESLLHLATPQVLVNYY